MEQNLELSKVEEHLFQQATLKHLPIYGGFELTPYCNLSCKMCYVHETAPGLPLLSGDQWLEIGRQASENGTLCIVLTGGEPLLHPDFKQIYSGLKQMGMVLTMNTNATLIDKEMADFLAKDMPRRVNVSLYGPNEEVYEKLCGNASGFRKTIRAIELMLERNIPVKINIIPNTVSFPYLDEMLAICRSYDLTVEMTTYLFEPLRKLSCGQQGYRLSPEQMAESVIKWDHYRFTEYERVTRAILCHQALDTFDMSRETEGTVPLRCLAGNSSFWICWDGKMNACVNMIRPRADVCESGFSEAWELTKEERLHIQVPAKCSTCSLSKFCLTCAAVGFHQNGVFEQVPDIMCQATEHYARKLAATVQCVERMVNETQSTD